MTFLWCGSRNTLEGPSVYQLFTKFAQFQSPLSSHLQNHCSNKLSLLMHHISQVNQSRTKSENHWSSGQRVKKNTLQLSDGGKRGENNNCRAWAVAEHSMDEANNLWNYRVWGIQRRLSNGTVLLKWIKDLKVSVETMKFLEENIGRIFCDINCSNICLALSFKAEEIKAKTNTGA